MDFASIVAAPYRDWTARFPGRRALGYLCSYVPEEIIHAAGFVPIRILPNAGPSPRADAHLQSYSCSLARGCLERSLTGELDFLEGVTFAASLAAQFGATVTDDALRASVRLYNANRRLLTDLHGRRDSISAVALWQATNAATFLPPEDFQRLAPEAIASLPVAERLHSAIPLVLSGATLDDPALLSLIEQLGARVAGDDFCNGERYFDTPAAEDGDPWEALADRYLHRVPCPCKHSSLSVREEHLLGLVRSHKAQGVLFLLKKFCDPHAWDYPPLAAALDRTSTPHLLVETEATTPLGVLRTRIEAFVEMIGVDA